MSLSGMEEKKQKLWNKIVAHDRDWQARAADYKMKANNFNRQKKEAAQLKAEYEKICGRIKSTPPKKGGAFDGEGGAALNEFFKQR